MLRAVTRDDQNAGILMRRATVSCNPTKDPTETIGAATMLAFATVAGWVITHAHVRSLEGYCGAPPSSVGGGPARGPAWSSAQFYSTFGSVSAHDLVTRGSSAFRDG